MEAEKLKIITEELSKYAGMVKEEEVQAAADLIASANRNFFSPGQGGPDWLPEHLRIVCCIWDLTYISQGKFPVRLSKKGM